MKKYVLYFVQELAHFRLPELASVCRMYDIELNIIRGSEDIEFAQINTFMIVHLPDDRSAELIARRCVLLKEIWEYWADGETYEEVHESVKLSKDLWIKYKDPSNSFKFILGGVNAGILPDRRVDIVNSFSYMGFEGPIQMKDPTLTVTLLEDHYPAGHLPSYLISTLRWIYMGRKLYEGQRHLLTQYSLKTRHYVGNTAMPPEISFLMANQALASPEKLIYDPFAGTGSMILSCAHFGAYVMGSAAGLGIRGKGNNKSTRSNFEFYNLKHKLLDLFVADITQFPIELSEIFDAVICDPPYGVRAGAKKLGRNSNRRELAEKPFLLQDGTYSHQLEDYRPPTQAFEMSEVLQTLLVFSHRLLKPGGRLVYFLPTMESHYKDEDVPILSGMKLIANSVQDFGVWSRRLITMEKSRTVFTSDQNLATSQNLPAHYEFRQKFFKDSGVHRT